MHTIGLDASNWKTFHDLYGDLLHAIGAPDWHGTSINALVGSMIRGGINELKPPHTIRIMGTSKLPQELLNMLELAQRDIADATARVKKREGREVGVHFELFP